MYVRYVRLQNRNDCCAERLTDVDIYLGSTAETYTGNALVKSDVSVLSNVMLEVEINALGRYIYLNRPSAAGLTVCNIAVAPAAPSIAVTPAGIRVAVAAASLGIALAPAAVRLTIATASVRLAVAAASFRLAVAAASVRVALAAASLRLSLPATSFRVAVATASLRLSLPAALLDLRAATTYQDSSLFDKQAPVSDLSYADSTTGRPWAECGHYTSQWWGVDLGSEVYVRYVRLQNRNDCCAERLTDVDIYLGSTAETYTGNALVKSDVSVLSNVMLEVEINALGRYIYLNRPSAAGLTVCNIAVAPAAPSIAVTPAGIRVAVAAASLGIALAPAAVRLTIATASVRLALAAASFRLAVAAASVRVALAAASLRLSLPATSFRVAVATASLRLSLPAAVRLAVAAAASAAASLRPACAAAVRFAVAAAALLDLRAATTYQDSSLFDKQAPVSDLSYADSTTGRPWAECGQYTSQWWGVDLGSEVYVRYVRLQNRNDCCAERLTDVDIYLGSTAETYTGNALVKSDVSVLSNVMLEVEINALGRYIYLNRPSAAGLTVCKFYVFAGNRNGPSPSASPSPPPPSASPSPPPPSASPSPPPPSASPSPPPPDVQLLDLRAATTYQDSSLFDKQAPVSDLSYADSTTGRPWAECGQYTSQWWGVDLGSEVYVRYVRLQNRNDCCAERLTDVDVYLGSTAETYTGNALVKSDVSVLSNVMLEVEINALGRYIYLNRPSAAGLTVCNIAVAPAAPSIAVTPAGIRVAVAAASLGITLAPAAVRLTIATASVRLALAAASFRLAVAAASVRVALAAASLRLSLPATSFRVAVATASLRLSLPAAVRLAVAAAASAAASLRLACAAAVRLAVAAAALLDLRAATTYQDSSLFDKQAPVSDLSYADSTTGRPWAECGQYTSQWWGVDLGSEVYVRYVRLQNRNDCCPHRLTGIDIYLGTTAETYTGNALVKSDVSVLSNVMLEVEINALGRYIYLNRPSATGLTVCKFYVYGYV
uniref:F5/8 type C domain-containing protein n=1 Tax=Emiliania huxleyi (strain CCMP1516) TaxID=280463 RepID=A0A0D3KDR8_EMIH1